MGRTRHAPPTGNGKIAVGDTAPDFTLPAQTGGTVRLHDLLGQKAIVLYFYGSWALLMLSRSCRCAAAMTKSHGVGDWLTSY